MKINKNKPPPTTTKNPCALKTEEGRGYKSEAKGLPSTPKGLGLMPKIKDDVEGRDQCGLLASTSHIRRKNKASR